MTSFPVKVRMEGLWFDVPHFRLLPVRSSDHQLGRAVYLQSKDATISEMTIRSFLPKSLCSMAYLNGGLGHLHNMRGA
jgi:hypothetical protein